MASFTFRTLAVATLAVLSSGPLAGAQALPNTTEAGPPTVDLGYATYEGTSLAVGVNQFLGMRFAEAPTGGLRWREPQDPAEEGAKVTLAQDVR